VSLGAVAAGAALYAVITRRSHRGAASDPAAGELDWLEPT
jgi:hypothetical protein